MRSQFDNWNKTNVVKWTQIHSIHSIPIRKRCTVLGTQILSIHNQMFYLLLWDYRYRRISLATNEFTIYPGNK